VLTAEGLLELNYCNWYQNKSMDDAEMTLSGSALQIFAAATGKARLR